MRTTTSIKLDKNNKEFAKRFFKSYDLTLSDGINIFLSKLAMGKKLPFDLEIFNEETQESIKQAQESEVTYNKNAKDIIDEIRG